ncbi:hypothetical protein D3C73_1055760 [compost metagenome]
MLQCLLPQPGKIRDVQLLLFRQQLGGLQRFDFFRQLLKYIALQTAEQKRAGPLGDRLARQIMERLFAGEQSRKNDAEDRPQILKSVLYRCAGQGEPVACLQQFCRLGGLGRVILNRLRFI